MKHILGLAMLIGFPCILNAQTLQTVTDQGNVTTNSIQVGGYSVNANTTKVFINNPNGKNWALSAGANYIRENGFHIYNWTDKPEAPLITVLDHGDVGFGTYLPKAGLHIAKSYTLGSPKVLKLFYEGTWGTEQYAADYRFLDIASTEQGNVLQVNGFGMGLGFEPPAYNSPDKLYVNGNVGIGTATPKEKLSVNGNIRAHEIKVETTGWPDYVLKPEYKLPSLAEVEKEIKEKGHLPDMPDAKEVEANGLELGEMNKLLLKKVEELTLHLIEKEKELNTVKITLEQIKHDAFISKAEQDKKLQQLAEALAKLVKQNQ